MDYRYAIIADAGLLAKLNKQLIEDEGHRNPMSVEQLVERMANWLAGEYQAVLFGEAEETIGYALFRREAEQIYLRQFFIVREQRRKGWGRAAIQWLRVHAWADAQRLRIEVLTDNEHGIAFWRSLGFQDYSLMMEVPLHEARGGG